MLEEGPWPHKAMWDALERARERAAGTYYDYGVTRPGVISQGKAVEQMGNLGTGPAPKQSKTQAGTSDSVDPVIQEGVIQEGVIPDSAAPDTGLEENQEPAGDEPVTTRRSDERSLLGSDGRSAGSFRPRESKPIGSGVR